MTHIFESHFNLQTYKELVEFFEKLLRKSKKKLVIILDSLDQLSTEDGALHMKWLPKKINKNVTIISSTLPGDEYKILPALKVIFVVILMRSL